MKKIISILIVAAMFISVPLAVAAANGKYEKRDVTAYLFSPDETAELECLFEKDVNLPYIKPEDFLDRAYEIDFSTKKNSDGTFTVSNEYGDMLIDPKADTLYFESFEDFAYNDAKSAYERPDDFNVYILDDEVKMYTKDGGDPNSLTLELSPYGIDIVADGDDVYMPLTTVCDVFSVTYQTAVYLDGGIYFIGVMDLVSGDGAYYDQTALFETDERDEKLIDFTYRELCFFVDNFYGYPVKCKASDSVREKGFDRTLDEYSELSAKAKELMMSNSRADLFKGLMYLDSIFNDGGHTTFSLNHLKALGEYFGSSFSDSAMEIIQQAYSDPDDPIGEYLYSVYEEEQSLIYISNAKIEAFDEDYEEVGSWDDIVLMRSGDTVIFSFDEFRDETVAPFKEALDYAAENGVKNFVIDLTTNSGGSSETLVYMLDMIGGDSETYIYNESTGNVLEGNYLVDRNLDGEFDEADDDVRYELNFAILTSRNSYSAANLLPCYAKEQGITVIGERSGGGTCALSVQAFPDSMMYAVSGADKLTYKNGEDVDGGVDPDVVLVENNDFSALFDIDMINEAISGTRPAPSTKNDLPETKPETAPSDNGGTEVYVDRSVISGDTATVIALAVLGVASLGAIAVIIISKKRS